MRNMRRKTSTGRAAVCGSNTAVRLKQIRTFTIIHKEKYHKNRDDVGVNPVISVFHARYGAKALNPLKFYARRRYKVHLTCLLSLHSERRQRRAKGKITCWFSPYVIPLRRWGLIQESLSTNINEGIIQIFLISFCKAKALAIHRLIGAQQSDSISFFAQTISGGEVPRRGTAGSSP